MVLYFERLSISSLCVGDADEEYVKDFSFGFSYILSLLQQNSLSCFLKIVFFFFFSLHLCWTLVL